MYCFKHGGGHFFDSWVPQPLHKGPTFSHNLAFQSLWLSALYFTDRLLPSISAHITNPELSTFCSPVGLLNYSPSTSKRLRQCVADWQGAHWHQAHQHPCCLCTWGQDHLVGPQKLDPSISKTFPLPFLMKSHRNLGPLIWPKHPFTKKPACTSLLICSKLPPMCPSRKGPDFHFRHAIHSAQNILDAA